MTGDVAQVAAHVLTGPPDRLRDAHTGAPFDVRTYSWMKHGDLDAVEALADELFDALLLHHPEVVDDDRVPVFPVAYLVVPPGCYYLAEAVLRRVNAARERHGRAPGRLVKVHKDSVTHTDYAGSSEQARRDELARIGFSLEESIAGCTAIVVDDVRVTGLAEETILTVLAQADAARLITAYVAVCDEALQATPDVEVALNHARVTSVLDMVPVVRAGRFGLTIRFLKRALAAADLAEFLQACPRSLVRQMLAGARATGPEFMAAYPDGMRILRAAAREFDPATDTTPERPEVAHA